MFHNISELKFRYYINVLMTYNSGQLKMLVRLFNGYPNICNNDCFIATTVCWTIYGLNIFV